MGLPKPGKGISPRLLTQDVLDVWQFWQKVHTKSGRAKSRLIVKPEAQAIFKALQWEPASDDQCPDGWSVKRVLCVILAYAYQAPADSPGVDFWRGRKTDLCPSTLIRVGTMLPRNAVWAVAWKTGGGQATQAPGSSPQANHDAQARSLLAIWTSGSGIRAKSADHGVSPDRWADYLGVANNHGTVHAFAMASAFDRSRMSTAWTSAVAQWLRGAA